MKSNENSSKSKSKVVRLLDKYDLQNTGSKLEARWTDASNDGASLRELAHDFNQEILHTAMDEANLDPLDGEVANIYRLLTDDDVIAGDRNDTRRFLERAGIDIDQLETDFVSRQAIHTYLTKVRNASHHSEGTNPVKTADTNLQQLKHRIATITDTKLAALRDAGHLTLGTYRVIVDIQIFCEDCGRQYSLTDLLASKGCVCEDS